jgi:hypothetical protein
MKQTLLFLCCFAGIGVQLMAQPDLTSGIAVHYSYYLAEVADGDDPQYVYTPGQAAMFTPFFVPELKKYSGAFLQHIEEMRSVTNHIGPLGPPVPMSLGSFRPDKALKWIDNGNLKRMGRMYINDEYTSTLTLKEGVIYKDDKLFIQDDELKLGKDTIYTEDLQSGEMYPEVVENNLDFFANAVGAGFIEEWEYDRNKARFEKDIEYLQLYRPVYDQLNGDYRGLGAIFNFKTGDFKKRFLDEEGLVKKDVESYVLFNLGFPSTQDPMISSEMVVDPMGHGYIEPSERYTLLLNIFKSVKEGQASIYAYDPIDFDLDKAAKATPQDFFESLVRKDSIYMEDLLTGEMHLQIVSLEQELRDVVGIRFFEDWYIDPDHLGLFKRVNGIVLLQEHKDEVTGELKGVKPFAPYYIKLNPKL